MNIGFALFLFGFLRTSCFNADVQEAELEKPYLTLHTLNTQYILTWEHEAAGQYAVNFTTQYLSKYKLKSKRKVVWNSVCVGPEHSCDLTGVKLHYHAMYRLRVRASAHGRHSDWAQKDFCPDMDADLGPPSKVELSPVSNLLGVAISPPLTSEGEYMKQDVPQMYYRIHYWSRLEDPQGASPAVVNSGSEHVTLPGLQSWTWYCVRVQSRFDYYNKTSSFTSTQCMQTEGEIPYWLIFLYFLASLVAAFLFVLGSSYIIYKGYRVLKTTYFPSIQLPHHIQEYLSDSPHSDFPRLLSLEAEVEIVCDNISVCLEKDLLEVHSPTSDLEDDCGRHSRQHSGDSGVYSTEGGSAQKRGGHSQPIVARLNSWDAPLLEHVNMEMGGELLDEGVVDEGVLDIGV
ncbi:interferon alpha/beta receptor 1b-like [Osmerus eperlanus]|uniref:interferon alpha/beta receptor 1b-like n=1 Tax=Osmerus eperlanus TaxID=29151 RepID=UPI002E0F706D